MITITTPLTLPAGKIKRIHVNGQFIRQNKRDGTHKPVYTVKCGNKNYYCRGFVGLVTAKQDFTNRLASGAVAWLETRNTVKLLP